MPRRPALMLTLALATAIHLDWHMARPAHHRLSFGLPYHWMITAAVFAAVGWSIARYWTRDRWRMGLIVFVGGAVLGQLVEPVLVEALPFQHRFAYDVEPERWVAFWKTIAAGLPLFVGALWLCAPRAARSALREQS